MSKRVAVLLAVGLFCFGGGLFAQQSQPISKQPETPVGRYAVSQSGNSAVLLDTTSGKTWLMRQSVDHEPYWMPARRFDSDDEYQKFLESEQKRKLELELKQIKAQLSPEAFEDYVKRSKR